VGRRLLVRDLHLWSGLLLPVPFLAVVVGRWGHGFRRDCARLGRFLTDDWRWLNRRQRRYGGLRVGKFNAGQKINAILVAGTLPVMFGTGLVLHWARSFPESVRTGATFVHDWGYVALSVLVAGHILKALADPVALHAMRTGLVPARWAQAAHPRWHDEVVGPSARADDPSVPAGGVGSRTPYDGPRSDQP
jgi:formate dehydrogenase subunit gamma